MRPFYWGLALKGVRRYATHGVQKNAEAMVFFHESACVTRGRGLIDVEQLRFSLPAEHAMGANGFEKSLRAVVQSPRTSSDHHPDLWNRQSGFSVSIVETPARKQVG